MGLFVVARLARRHGLTVSLERNAEGGTTAKVFVPRPLLSSTERGRPRSRADAPERVVERDATADGVFRARSTRGRSAATRR